MAAYSIAQAGFGAARLPRRVSTPYTISIASTKNAPVIDILIGTGCAASCPAYPKATLPKMRPTVENSRSRLLSARTSAYALITGAVTMTRT